MVSARQPVVLCILDGWGARDEEADNAIAQAATPHWDQLLRDYPHGILDASEAAVGLPEGQMGNSEVGHMTIGAGRVIYQELPRINRALADGSVENSTPLSDFIARLIATGGVCHLMGLVSPGGVHSHQNHIIAFAKIIANAGVPVKLHAFLDGRDTPPHSAASCLNELTAKLTGYSTITLASVIGRFYAMDRDHRWERTQSAYELLVTATGHRAINYEAAIMASSERGESDEFVAPTAIGDYSGMQDGDGIFIVNFRADRVRQILTALLDPAFSAFSQPHPVKFAAALGMVEYSSDLNARMTTLFPAHPPRHSLGEIVAAAGMRQLRLAETEKYAHVTFFLNGGIETIFPGEERILVPSPKVKTYDLQPEMSAVELTDRLVEAISSQRYDLIVVNYANADMVGHSGNLAATKLAIEAVDYCLGRVVEATTISGAVLIVTADHGNAEMMRDAATNVPHTAHTLNLVPIVLINPRATTYKSEMSKIGGLSDVAPTVLSLLGLAVPPEMTGKNLFPGAKSRPP